MILLLQNYLVRVVKEPNPLVLKSKELRYKSFFNDNNIKLDSDKFDQLCDHLVVVDRSIADDYVVGVTDFIKTKKKRE